MAFPIELTIDSENGVNYVVRNAPRREDDRSYNINNIADRARLNWLMKRYRTRIDGRFVRNANEVRGRLTMSNKLTVELVAGEDLTGFQWHWVSLNFNGEVERFHISFDQSPRAGDSRPVGVLINEPTAQGQVARVVVAGKVQVEANEALTPGRPITTAHNIGSPDVGTNRGRLIDDPFESAVLGHSLGTAAGPGDLVDILISVSVT